MTKINERWVAEVYKEVKEFEREYGSEENRSINDIRACFADDYIVKVYEEELQLCREHGDSDEELPNFKDFLISFIEQNIQFE